MKKVYAVTAQVNGRNDKIDIGMFDVYEDAAKCRLYINDHFDEIVYDAGDEDGVAWIHESSVFDSYQEWYDERESL